MIDTTRGVLSSKYNDCPWCQIKQYKILLGVALIKKNTAAALVKQKQMLMHQARKTGSVECLVQYIWETQLGDV